MTGALRQMSDELQDYLREDQTFLSALETLDDSPKNSAFLAKIARAKAAAIHQTLEPWRAILAKRERLAEALTTFADELSS